MSDPQSTRPDPVGPDGWPFVDQSPVVSAAPMGVARRILQALVSIAGLQVLAAGVVLLVVSSYRRAAAEWLLPLVGVLDLVFTLQIVALAIRDVRLAGRQTAWARFVLMGVVVAMLGGVGAGGFAVHRYVNRPVEGAFETPVVDGDLRFTASEFRCGGEIEGVAVRGVMCRVRLDVANAGSARARFEAGEQRLRGEGDEPSGSLLAEGRRTGTAWEIEPGDLVQGILVFDAPRGFAPRSLELRAEEGSRGVRLLIPSG